MAVLRGSPTGQEVEYEGEYSENEQQVDQATRNMEHQESAAPRKEKYKSN